MERTAMIGQSGLLLMNNLTTSQEQASEEAQTPPDAVRKNDGGGVSGFAKALLMSDPATGQPQSPQVKTRDQAASVLRREAEGSDDAIQRNFNGLIHADWSSIDALSEAAAQIAVPGGRTIAPAFAEPAASSSSAGHGSDIAEGEVFSLSPQARGRDGSPNDANRTLNGIGENRPSPPPAQVSPAMAADKRKAPESGADTAATAMSARDRGAEPAYAPIDDARQAQDRPEFRLPASEGYSPVACDAEARRIPGATVDAPATSDELGLADTRSGAEVLDERPDSHPGAERLKQERTVAGPTPPPQAEIENRIDDAAPDRRRSEQLADAPPDMRTEEGREAVPAAGTEIQLRNGAAQPAVGDPSVAGKRDHPTAEHQTPHLDPNWPPPALQAARPALNAAPGGATVAATDASVADATLNAVERLQTERPPATNPPPETGGNRREPTSIALDTRPERPLASVATGGARQSPGPEITAPPPEPPSSAPPPGATSGARTETLQNLAPHIPSPVQMTTGAPPVARKLSLVDPVEGRIGVTGGATTGQTRGAAPAGPPPSAAPDPKVVTQQIAQALVRMDGARTEVTLDPVELGRVSLTFVTKDDGVSVSVVADRPETADLLRRNSEQLQRDLSDAGYEGVELDFEQNENSQGKGRQATAGEEGAAAQGQSLSYRVAQSDAGLDIRI